MGRGDEVPSRRRRMRIALAATNGVVERSERASATPSAATRARPAGTAGPRRRRRRPAGRRARRSSVITAAGAAMHAAGRPASAKNSPARRVAALPARRPAAGRMPRPCGLDGQGDRRACGEQSARGRAPSGPRSAARTVRLRTAQAPPEPPRHGDGGQQEDGQDGNHARGDPSALVLPAHTLRRRPQSRAGSGSDTAGQVAGGARRMSHRRILRARQRRCTSQSPRMRDTRPGRRSAPGQ